MPWRPGPSPVRAQVWFTSVTLGNSATAPPVRAQPSLQQPGHRRELSGRRQRQQRVRVAAVPQQPDDVRRGPRHQQVHQRGTVHVGERRQRLPGQPGERRRDVDHPGRRLEPAARGSPPDRTAATVLGTGSPRGSRARRGAHRVRANGAARCARRRCPAPRPPRTATRAGRRPRDRRSGRSAARGRPAPRRGSGTRAGPGRPPGHGRAAALRSPRDGSRTAGMRRRRSRRRCRLRRGRPRGRPPQRATGRTAPRRHGRVEVDVGVRGHRSTLGGGGQAGVISRPARSARPRNHPRRGVAPGARHHRQLRGTDHPAMRERREHRDVLVGRAAAASPRRRGTPRPSTRSSRRGRGCGARPVGTSRPTGAASGGWPLQSSTTRSRRPPPSPHGPTPAALQPVRRDARVGIRRREPDPVRCRTRPAPQAPRQPRCPRAAPTFPTSVSTISTPGTRSRRLHAGIDTAVEDDHDVRAFRPGPPPRPAERQARGQQQLPRCGRGSPPRPPRSRRHGHSPVRFATDRPAPLEDLEQQIGSPRAAPAGAAVASRRSGRGRRPRATGSPPPGDASGRPAASRRAPGWLPPGRQARQIVRVSGSTRSPRARSGRTIPPATRRDRQLGYLDPAYPASRSRALATAAGATSAPRAASHSDRPAAPLSTPIEQPGSNPRRYRSRGKAAIVSAYFRFSYQRDVKPQGSAGWFVHRLEVGRRKRHANTSSNGRWNRATTWGGTIAASAGIRPDRRTWLPKLSIARTLAPDRGTSTVRTRDQGPARSPGSPSATSRSGTP